MDLKKNPKPNIYKKKCRHL